jgi:hypothetical protein
MPTKTAELTGAQLDFWVAMAEVAGDAIHGAAIHGDACWLDDGSPYYPSTSWAFAGPIIERERIAIVLIAGSGDAEWCAFAQGSDVRSGYFEARYDEAQHRGPTPLIAAMRCYVASKFGEEV